MDTRVPHSDMGANAPASDLQGPQTTDRSAQVETPAIALSIQNQMARLNMVQAHTCKQAAVEKLDEVKAVQQEIQKLRGFILRLSQCKTGDRDLSEFVDIEKALGIHLSTHEEAKSNTWAWSFAAGPLAGLIGLVTVAVQGRFDAPKRLCGKDDADVNMRIVSSVQEQATAKMQSAMTQLQDFMAQYQSYVDGAQTAAAKANALMMQLAKN